MQTPPAVTGLHHRKTITTRQPVESEINVQRSDRMYRDQSTAADRTQVTLFKFLTLVF